MIPGFLKLSYYKRLALLGLQSLEERLNDSLQHHWTGICVRVIFHHACTRHEYKLTKQSQIGRETALFHRATCQQMEQLGSAHIECNNCECFQYGLQRVDLNSLGWVYSRTEVRLTL